MSRLSFYFLGAYLDVAIALLLFINWLTVALIVDAIGGERAARVGASVWLSISSLSVSTVSFYYSFRKLGTPDEKRSAPETVLGIFAEIVAWTETWGVLFTAARTWSLDDDNPWHQDPFLHNTANSVFEMGLVQAGVGWASIYPPVTFAERVVAWAAAYVGGVLVMNLYLLSIVVGQRGWWTTQDSGPVATGSAATQWRFESLRTG